MGECWPKNYKTLVLTLDTLPIGIYSSDIRYLSTLLPNVSSKKFNWELSKTLSTKTHVTVQVLIFFYVRGRNRALFIEYLYVIMFLEMMDTT